MKKILKKKSSKNFKRKKVKAVVFDVGGVLQLNKKSPTVVRGKIHNKGVHEFIANKLHLSIDKYFDSIDKIYPESIKGKISKKEFIRKISDNLKTNPEKLEKIYKKAYLKNFKLNKKLLKFAEKLKNKNYKIAILSDMWYFSKDVLIPKKLSEIFNISIISCEVGFRKPNRLIYELLLKKLKIKPSEIIFIDNQEWNLKPARKLGIKTILFHNNKQLLKQLGELNVFI